jgi:hypothetical protein
MAARIKTKEKLIQKIFQERTPWFEEVCWNLLQKHSRSGMSDRRASTRALCPKCPSPVTVTWLQNGSLSRALGFIVDSSEQGVGVEFKDQDAPGQNATVSFLEPLPELDIHSNHALEYLLAAGDNKFRVASTKKQGTSIRLGLCVQSKT